MDLSKRTIIGVLIGGWTWLAFAGNVVAENTADGIESRGWHARGDRQGRVVQRGLMADSGPEQARAGQERVVRWSPSRPARLSTVSASALAGQDGQEFVQATQEAGKAGQAEVDPGDEQLPLTPIPMDTPQDSGGGVAPGLYEPGSPFGGCGPGGCSGDCGGCYEDCGGCSGGCGPGLWWLRQAWWARDLSLFGGAHGFKGPLDQGRNGNFGLHEGVNFGAPLGGPMGWGYQVGFAAVHSNFSGDQVGGSPARRGDRDQFFFTTGIFRRATHGGLQWGVAFDLLRDLYYVNVDVRQLRSEMGYVFPGGREEIGYFGAYGIGDDEVDLGSDGLTSVEPTDMFAFYYRKRFENGGSGRLWAGFSGKGDGLLGGDLLVPLGRGWALENRAHYLIPNEGRGEFGQPEEAWGLTIHLVWYLGQSARRAQFSPFHPMFSVADNSLFMVDLVGP